MSYFTQARYKEHPSQASPFIWERKEDSFFIKKKTRHKVPHARKEKQEEKNTKDEEVSIILTYKK